LEDEFSMLGTAGTLNLANTKSMAKVNSFIDRSANILSQAWYTNAWWPSILTPLSWFYGWVSQRRANVYRSGSKTPGALHYPLL